MSGHDAAIPGHDTGMMSYATIADAMLDRLMQRHHRFTLTGESLRQRPKTTKQEKHPDPS